MEEARETRIYSPNPPHHGNRRIDMLFAAFNLCDLEGKGVWESEDFEPLLDRLHLNIPAGRKASDDLHRRIAEMEKLHPKGSIAAFAGTLLSPTKVPLLVQSFTREMAYMYGAFALFDDNGNGVIEPIEFGQTITKIFGWRPTLHELQKLHQLVDESGDGMVSWGEFVLMLHLQRGDKSGQYIHQIRESLMSYFNMFSAFDISPKREIDFVIAKTHIRDVCECLGLPLSETQSRDGSPESIVEAISPHREQHDIHYEDFISYLTKPENCVIGSPGGLLLVRLGELDRWARNVMELSGTGQRQRRRSGVLQVMDKTESPVLISEKSLSRILSVLGQQNQVKKKNPKKKGQETLQERDEHDEVTRVCRVAKSIDGTIRFDGFVRSIAGSMTKLQVYYITPSPVLSKVLSKARCNILPYPLHILYNAIPCADEGSGSTPYRRASRYLQPSSGELRGGIRQTRGEHLPLQGNESNRSLSGGSSRCPH